MAPCQCQEFDASPGVDREHQVMSGARGCLRLCLAMSSAVSQWVQGCGASAPPSLTSGITIHTPALPPCLFQPSDSRSKPLRPDPPCD